MSISLKDRIRGSLIAGAAGDALGYAVEFIDLASIRHYYGEGGIREYALCHGEALFSDDTQMTMFTATGLLRALAQNGPDCTVSTAAAQVSEDYLDWYRTQYADHVEPRHGRSRLLSIGELYSRRAPGNTCLSGISTRAEAPAPSDYIGSPINNSCGCGGVMRTAPAGMVFPDAAPVDIQLLGAQCGAITHSHPLGYIPSGILSHIVHRALWPAEGMTGLRDIIAEARATAEALYEGTPELEKQLHLLDLAVDMADDTEQDDASNIRLLGEGWVGHEALAIAVYCALRYERDPSACLIAAVNHSGDSDSTGAIAGNIVGALIGYEALEEKWKTDLELRDTLLELADDIALYAETGTVPEEATWQSRYAER